MTDPRSLVGSSVNGRLNQVGSSVRAVIDAVSQSVSTEDLVRRGPRKYRLVDAGKLVDQIVSAIALLIDAFELQSARAFIRERDASLHALETALAEKEDALRKEGANRVLRSLLDFVDVVEAVVDSLAESASKSMARALDKRIDALFRTHGYERVETSGVAFDPERHECVDSESDPQQPANAVLREVSRGYVREGRVLRFAKVVVNRGS